MRTWLLVAAERREFDGILQRCGESHKMNWPDAQFTRESQWRGDRWIMIANGPGPRLVTRALEKKMEVTGLISTGFCGALDPSLRVGDIVRGGPDVVHSVDRVASTAAEKRALHAETGARAIEMESAAVRAKAAEWGVHYDCIRAVSDTADEDMPLDFNRYRDADGRFSRTRIALAAMLHPFSVMPRLTRLDRNCRVAAEALGEFFANSQL